MMNSRFHFQFCLVRRTVRLCLSCFSVAFHRASVHVLSAYIVFSCVRFLHSELIVCTHKRVRAEIVVCCYGYSIHLIAYKDLFLLFWHSIVWWGWIGVAADRNQHIVKKLWLNKWFAYLLNFFFTKSLNNCWWFFGFWHSV